MDCGYTIAKSSNCPGSLWKDTIVPLLHRPNMVLVDIGSNKGYNINSFLLRYHEQWNVSNTAYFKFQSPFLEHAECGTCGACKEEPLNRLQKSNVRFWAVEMAWQTYRPLRKALNHFQAPGIIIHAAVSDKKGHAFSPMNVQAGRENILMTRTGRKVRQTTVDHIFRAETNVIDVLSVDTEGNDALVLKGAYYLLKSKRVRVVEFEYHGFGYWGKGNHLNSTVMHILNGYTCFWQGSKRHNGRLHVYNPSCDYEFKSWSNLVCAHESNIIDMFKHMSIP